MKKFTVLLAALVLGLILVSGAQAATPSGEIQHGMFASMGLSGMAPLSDADGLKVRGKGFRGFRIDISRNYVTQTAGNVTSYQSNKVYQGDNNQLQNSVNVNTNGNVYNVQFQIPAYHR